MHATATFCSGSILSLVQILLLLFLGIEMYDNEFETKERKFEPRIKLSYNTFPYWDWDGLTPSLFEEVWERGPRHFSS